VPALSQEAEEIQNPGLGAMAVWRFATGYAPASQENRPTPVPLLFLVLPLLYHEETFEVLSSTRRGSGLRGFAGKFSDSQHRKADILLELHGRCVRMRLLSLDALRVALATKLLALDLERAAVFPLTRTSPRAGVPTSIQLMLQNAEKLGAWCAELSLHEISLILKVSF
jgi:hypothetical protein